MALRKVFTELGLRFGRCEEYTKVILEKPSKEQLEQALDTIEEEHHAILFLYKADEYKYKRLLEEMENYVLQKKDPFPKRLAAYAEFSQDVKSKLRANIIDSQRQMTELILLQQPRPT